MNKRTENRVNKRTAAPVRAALKRAAAILLLLAALPAGCAPSATREPAQADDPADGTALLMEEPVYLPVAPQHRADTMASNGQFGYFIRQISESFQPQPPDGQPGAAVFSMAYRADFAAGTIRPLCGEAGCGHGTPDCPAWVELRPAMGIAAAQDCLFWVSPNYRPAYDEGQGESLRRHETQFACIEQTDPLGGGRRRVCTLAENQCLYPEGGGLWYDGERLGFLIYDAQRCAQAFVVLDLASGEQAASVPLPCENEKQSWSLCGSLDGAPLLARTERTALENGRPGSYTVTDFALFTLSWTDGALGQAYRGANIWQAVPLAQGIAALLRDNETVDLIDCAAGETVCTVRLPEGCSSFSGMEALPDGRLGILCRSGAGQWQAFAVDPLRGALVPRRLVYRTAYNEERVVPILAQTQAEYLVMTDCVGLAGEQRAPWRYADIVTGDGYRFVYALIDKEAYWAGTPDYRALTLTA